MEVLLRDEVMFTMLEKLQTFVTLVYCQIYSLGLPGVSFYNLLFHVVCFKFSKVCSKPHHLHECTNIWVGFPFERRSRSHLPVYECEHAGYLSTDFRSYISTIYHIVLSLILIPKRD